MKQMFIKHNKRYLAQFKFSRPHFWICLSVKTKVVQIPPWSRWRFVCGFSNCRLLKQKAARTLTVQKWIPTIWFGLISEAQTHTLRQQLWRCQSLQHLLILCFVRQRLACLLSVDCKDVVECISFSLKEGGPHSWMEFQLLARHLWSGQRLSVCLGYRSDTWACSLEPYPRSDGTFTRVNFGPQRPRGLTVNDNIYNLMTTVLESARDD